MVIDPISNGIVLDHITAGRSMELYQILKLHKLKCSVAVLTNVPSRKMGRKDIIKLDEVIDLNWDVLGYLAPDCTVNIIREGEEVEKRHPELPEKLVGVIACKNPRCITTIEQGVQHMFYLADPRRKIYRCRYCDEKYTEQEHEW